MFELLDGVTLRQRLGGGPLPARKAVDYAVQIAHGLAAAHEKGIVHRDLKPENLFVTRDGRVKILDFGLAKLRPALDAHAPREEGATVSTATGAGVVLGTVGYMSPEQVKGDPADHRSDVFSFGSVLYEMLSGRRPFSGETSAELMTAILKEEPPELAKLDVPPGLERVVRRCLEKRPEERFQSARDIGFALEAVSGVSSPALSATRPSRGEEKAERAHCGSGRRRRRRAGDRLLRDPPSAGPRRPRRSNSSRSGAASSTRRASPRTATRSSTVPGGREAEPGVFRAPGRPGIESTRRARGQRRVHLAFGRAGDADWPHVPDGNAPAHSGPPAPGRRGAPRSRRERARGRLGS